MSINDIDTLDAQTIVRVLYRALLDRNPDLHGELYHTSNLSGAKTLHEVALEIIGGAEFGKKHGGPGRGLATEFLKADSSPNDEARFAQFVPPPTEAAKAYVSRLMNGFFARYCQGEVILDVGFTGYANPQKRASLPGAIGVDLDYPGYDGLHLPWSNDSVDCIFSSHCLEHVQFYQEVIRDWHRVLKIGGHIVCIVPSRDLYEKKLFPPSRYNTDHKRFYTASRLVAEFEEALAPNSFRIRHVRENDYCYNYAIGPEEHAVGCYEIELVLEKMLAPTWTIE